VIKKLDKGEFERRELTAKELESFKSKGSSKSLPKKSF